MSDQEIIQLTFFTPGQAQSERFPEALDKHYIDIDEHSTEQLLAFMQQFAGHIHYYHHDNADTPAGRWDNFFPFTAENLPQWLAGLKDDTSPHLALIRSFLALYQHPQRVINELTGKHLDFYYRQVLGLTPQPARPDQAHAIFTLKNNATAVLITPEHSLTAGKDDTGIERLYQPLFTTVIQPASVVFLKSNYHDQNNLGTLRHAPIANSSDGLGTALDTEDGKWPPFGHAQLPAAELGFAISSSILRMQSGLRKIKLICSLSGVQHQQLRPERLVQAFKLYLTAASNWLELGTITPHVEGSTLIFNVTINADQEAIIDYDPALHGYDYDAGAPVLQCLLNTDQSSTGTQVFAGIRINSMAIQVDVSDVPIQQLENDLGTLDATKAFMPFGPEPQQGSRLRIGHPESLSKPLTELSLSFDWQDIPDSLGSHYHDYVTTVSNTSFTTSITFADGHNWHFQQSGKTLFDASHASHRHRLTFKTATSTGRRSFTPATVAWSLRHTKGSWAWNDLQKLQLRFPVYAAGRIPGITESANGYITLSLEQDFLHQEYRREYVRNILKFSKVWQPDAEPTLLNEPYTPVLQSLTLSYKANSGVIALNSHSLTDFTHEQLRFYHIRESGQYREHTYQRDQFDFLTDKSVTLLPDIPNRGELLIGLDGLTGGDSISLLFQVAEGSADPELDPQQVDWAVLCDNYWKPMSTSDVARDSTNGLLTSGVIQLVIPTQASTANTLLPAGLIWLKASVKAHTTALPSLLAVLTNAVTVQFTDHNNDPLRLATPLPAGSLKKLKTPMAAIKSVAQPYASFGGKTVEQDDGFNTRVAERLRHKDRAINSWDYERLILDHFPSIHRVKVVPHARPGSWSAPGHILAVVIPNLSNRNAIDPLKPKVDSAEIAAIKTMLKQRTGMGVEIHVRNPLYQQIQLSFKVSFHTGFEFNYYQQQLQQALIQNLSPWAFSDATEMQFGGRIYKSVLIDFIEELEYVDYISAVELRSFTDTTTVTTATSGVLPATPDTILISAPTHQILPME
ncbi:baseplate J/gp47 family protein [Gynuella sp.]|uniref:baseplate J/gp47 family protein n=1 Tax=Gynuella sp. TaxID=2969146 RepID=UPI003D0A7810